MGYDFIINIDKYKIYYLLKRECSSEYLSQFRRAVQRNIAVFFCVRMCCRGKAIQLAVRPLQRWMQ